MVPVLAGRAVVVAGDAVMDVATAEGGIGRLTGPVLNVLPADDGKVLVLLREMVL
jgi:hypothetical protein